MIDWIAGAEELATLTQFLLDRDLIVADEETPHGYRGKREGFRYPTNGIPNPILGNNMLVFLGRFARDELAHQMEGAPPHDPDNPDTDTDFKRSKFGIWLKANSNAVGIGMRDHIRLVYDDDGNLTGQEVIMDPDTGQPKEETIVPGFEVKVEGKDVIVSEHNQYFGSWQ